MKRDKKLLNIRVNMVKLAINNPKKAAKELHLLADALGNTRTSSDTVNALTHIFGVSERTIFRDLMKD